MYRRRVLGLHNLIIQLQVSMVALLLEKEKGWEIEAENNQRLIF